MGVPTSEVGYTSAMPRREDHEVNKRTRGGIGGWGGKSVPASQTAHFLSVILHVSKVKSVRDVVIY